MRYKYEEYLEKNDCQFDEFEELQITGYRFITDNIEDEFNYLPNAFVGGNNRLNRLHPHKNCTYFALSFFETNEKCKQRLKQLKKNSNNKYPATLIAEVCINEECGICSKPNDSGHFEMHEYKDHDIDYIINTEMVTNNG
jgi:hypothetical protein